MCIDDMITEGISTERIHSTMANKLSQTVSETVSGPKVIDNRKLAFKKSTEVEQQHHSEAEILVSRLRNVPLTQSVSFNKEQYISVNSLPNMLNDVYRFCVLGNSILQINTTFELVDGLWLTETTFTNEALVDLSGKHPEFPGLSFWHFKKTCESYRRFAGELAIQNPLLLGIKKVGHDLDGEDFDIKLESLKTVWENRAPEFHDWFKKNRSEKFKSCLVIKGKPWN